MERQKNIYKKHEILTFTLTTIQTAFIANLFSLLFLHPIKTLFNPLNLLHSFYNFTTICFVISGFLFIYARCCTRNKKLSFFQYILLFGLSHFLFTSNFLSKTFFLDDNGRKTGILHIKLHINIPYLYNVLASSIFGLLSVFRFNYINNALIFTNVGGIVFYFLSYSNFMFNSIIKYYALNLLFDYSFTALYFVFFRFIVNFVCIFLRIEFVNKSALVLFKHMILNNASAFLYYLMVELIDQLITFNSSLLDKEWTEFVFHSDINLSRYSFHQVSGLAYKYTYVCKMISKSQSSLLNFEDYINFEYGNAKAILDKMIQERKSLDNKLWITVPQVDKGTQLHVSKENVSLHKQHNFTKKFRTYGLFDRYINMLIYYLKIKFLVIEFDKQMYYIERIDNFIVFLVKHKDCYLLLGDFDRKYSEIHKNFLEAIKKTEKECNLDLKITI